MLLFVSCVIHTRCFPVVFPGSVLVVTLPLLVHLFRLVCHLLLVVRFLLVAVLVVAESARRAAVGIFVSMCIPLSLSETRPVSPIETVYVQLWISRVWKKIGDAIQLVDLGILFLPPVLNSSDGRSISPCSKRQREGHKIRDFVRPTVTIRCGFVLSAVRHYPFCR